MDLRELQGDPLVASPQLYTGTNEVAANQVSKQFLSHHTLSPPFPPTDFFPASYAQRTHIYLSIKPCHVYFSRAGI